ncbi:UDP-N-acetylglucosamine 2-epimerase (hydrolyzing) [Nocardioides panacisoli]|uniref:UDP-N-acetylglucosamine 2-epimerase n=1 Tax=Nocardioides panacisoli TaxID=627624 RepID=UPI001C637105|nr:UDP-N-acetylglucosamine 2-epimerase [Nocardioides panacisoli]QYJ03729.1 UDP-N-acetylglucosamine 2-epimerase (hydrolyzing) [Nocardioides panacisoli]
MTPHESPDRSGEARRITFVTGTRADFGKVQPLANAAARHGHEAIFFVTGMHMLRKYGDTRLEVRRQAPGDIYEFVNQSPGDAHDTVLAKTMQGFADWVTEYPTDLVVIHGDRVEALAIALVCAMRYIPCAHVEGGEVSGTIDEIYRHCNSKLCRYHFVSSDTAASRLQALGEHPDDIYVIGSPELDFHGSDVEVRIEEVRKHYEIDFADYGIAVFHPVTSESDTIAQQTADLFDALEESGRSFVVICPNNDPGSEHIFARLESLPPERFRVIPSMRFSYFSVLMRHAAAIVGNSSLGVREAPFLGVPSLDVGSRQTNRATDDSITHVAADERSAIRSFLDQEWSKRYPASTAFGRGDAGEQFSRILAGSEFWERDRQKSFYEQP